MSDDNRPKAISWLQVIRKRAQGIGIDLAPDKPHAHLHFKSVEKFLEHEQESEVEDPQTSQRLMAASSPDPYEGYVPPIDIEDLYDRYLKGERDFRRVNLDGCDLRGMKLRGVSFSLGSLANADMKDCDLVECKFDYAKLDGAIVQGGKFLECSFVHASLSGVFAKLAMFCDCSFRSANMKNGKFWGSDFRASNISSASLDGADLRSVTRMEFSNNAIRDTRFSGNAADRWSILRRSYTGPRMAFHVILLLLFLLPYVAKIVFWSSVVVLQQSAGVLEKKQDVIDITKDIRLEGHSVFSLILGIGDGLAPVALTLTLILFNICRGILTWKMGPLREEEERNKIIPSLSQYGIYYGMHLVVVALGYVAAASFVWNLFNWMSRTAWIPVFTPNAL